MGKRVVVAVREVGLAPCPLIHLVAEPLIEILQCKGQ